MFCWIVFLPLHREYVGVCGFFWGGGVLLFVWLGFFNEVFKTYSIAYVIYLKYKIIC